LNHRIPLKDTPDWQLWRCCALRGTGFPIDLVLRLASPVATEAVDQALACEEQAKSEDTRANVSALLDQETTRLSHVLADIVQMDRFQEALLWQNRSLLHTAIAPFLRHCPENRRTARYRAYEALFVRYLQRYCVKNETIGFFGPTGWATFSEQHTPIIVQPGATLLHARRVHLEAWAIDALAKQLARNPAMRRWIAPRLHPSVALAETAVYIPGNEPLPLSAARIALLRLCDGTHRAIDIAHILLQQPEPAFAHEQVVYQLLEQLQQQNILTWDFSVPIEPGAQQALQQQLEQIEDISLRTWALTALHELEERRQSVEQAAGNTVQLNEALEALETTFTRLTQHPPTRCPGEFYTGRTLVYEDCRRDIAVTFGRDLISRLSAPLDLLLTAARWFTYQTAQAYRHTFTDLYHTIVQETGSSIVDLACFWQRAYPLLFVKGSRPVDAIRRTFQELWAGLLPFTGDEHQVHYISKQLSEKVHQLFAAPERGWLTARYHSLDLMIAATDAEAINQGDYQLILSEAHMGRNTLDRAVFIPQHPAPQDVVAMVEADIPQPRIVPIPPHSWGLFGTRSTASLISPKDRRVLLFPHAHPEQLKQAFALSDFIIEASDQGLQIKTRDRQQAFDPIEFFADAFSAILSGQFSLLPSATHTPRMAIDRLIIARETWTFAAQQLAFVREKQEGQRFIGARRWIKEQGLPRFIFVKVPDEVKPFYIDLSSPLYVELLAKAVRRTLQADPMKKVTISEMIPAPHQSWLTDAKGQRYTCELRCVAVENNTPE
jgi:hypothetical protein